MKKAILVAVIVCIAMASQAQAYMGYNEQEIRNIFKEKYGNTLEKNYLKTGNMYLKGETEKADVVYLFNQTNHGAMVAVVLIYPKREYLQAYKDFYNNEFIKINEKKWLVQLDDQLYVIDLIEMDDNTYYFQWIEKQETKKE